MRPRGRNAAPDEGIAMNIVWIVLVVLVVLALVYFLRGRSV
jgi:hypothetical protein